MITLRLDSEEAEALESLLRYGWNPVTTRLHAQLVDKMQEPDIHLACNRLGPARLWVACGFTVTPDNHDKNPYAYNPRDVTCKKCRHTTKYHEMLGEPR
jgi:hypothetical protein